MKLLVALRHTAFCSMSSTKQTNVAEEMKVKLGRQTKASKKSLDGSKGGILIFMETALQETPTSIRAVALLNSTRHQNPQPVREQVLTPCAGCVLQKLQPTQRASKNTAPSRNPPASLSTVA